MTLVRAYLPLRRADVAALLDRQVVSAPRQGMAPPERTGPDGPGGNRARSRDAEREDAEYEALQAAARVALRDRAPGDRVVIAAVDLSPRDVQRGAGAAITVTGQVPLRRIVAFHLDTGDQDVDSRPWAGPTGDPIDLLWYDVTEVEQVAALVGGA